MKAFQWELICSMRTAGQTNGRRDGQTYRHDEANSRSSQSCERTYQSFGIARLQAENNCGISLLSGKITSTLFIHCGPEAPFQSLRRFL